MCVLAPVAVESWGAARIRYQKPCVGISIPIAAAITRSGSRCWCKGLGALADAIGLVTRFGVFTAEVEITVRCGGEGGGQRARRRTGETFTEEDIVATLDVRITDITERLAFRNDQGTAVHPGEQRSADRSAQGQSHQRCVPPIAAPRLIACSARCLCSCKTPQLWTQVRNFLFSFDFVKFLLGTHAAAQAPAPPLLLEGPPLTSSSSCFSSSPSQNPAHERRRSCSGDRDCELNFVGV